MMVGNRGLTTISPTSSGVVEWLVKREGQRKTAALLGVNRKTVALALRRERLTGRMTLAVQRLMANLDDPGWERTTALDRLEARIRLAFEAVDDLARLVERLTRRVEALVLQRRFLNLVSHWPEIASRKARPPSCQARGQVAMERSSRSFSSEPSL